jgi:arylsulfatase A-like enzyme
VEWLERQSADTPFFLYFALPSPHAPIIPNDEFRGSSQAGAYGDFVVETDTMAGRILDALERKGFAGDTIVVFTSDNGPEHYAYDRLRNYGHWSSGPSRGVKRDVWEGGHRVPFVVRWPGKVAPGSVAAETVSQVDLAATFAALIGYELSPDVAIDSYDLGPVLLGREYARPLRFATVQNTFEQAYALRQGDWLFIDAPTGQHSKCPDWFTEQRGYAADTTPGLLYNLAADPAQHSNLYGQYPDRVADMKSLLDRYRAGEPCAPHAAGNAARR